MHILYTNIDKTLVNSLHRLLNCEIGGLDCHVITKQYRTRVYCVWLKLVLFITPRGVQIMSV